jgi:hypothetical protein
LKRYLISLLCILSISVQSLADGDTEFHQYFTGDPSWTNFDQYMHQAEKEDEKIGWSYVISGVLVGVGGTLGSQYGSDDATKVMYGLTSTVGLVAAAYGLERLYNGNNYTSFYQSLLQSSLTEQQRNELVANYIRNEREKEKRRKRIAMITNVVMAGLNIYSASQESDKNASTFFYGFAAVNLGLALSYTF